VGRMESASFAAQPAGVVTYWDESRRSAGCSQGSGGSQAIQDDSRNRTARAAQATALRAVLAAGETRGCSTSPRTS
jgi:hypothetical protein